VVGRDLASAYVLHHFNTFVSRIWTETRTKSEESLGLRGRDKGEDGNREQD
jgi:hypothetical protein